MIENVSIFFNSFPIRCAYNIFKVLKFLEEKKNLMLNTNSLEVKERVALLF